MHPDVGMCTGSLPMRVGCAKRYHAINRDRSPDRTALAGPHPDCGRAAASCGTMVVTLTTGQVLLAGAWQAYDLPGTRCAPGPGRHKVPQVAYPLRSGAGGLRLVRGMVCTSTIGCPHWGQCSTSGAGGTDTGAAAACPAAAAVGGASAVRACASRCRLPMRK